jgi:AcrR family transcriptional regulator
MASIRVPRKRPNAYQHGDLRNALIQAGLKLLAEGGVGALSLRAAAELAGVSHAAPYRHFRDKSELVGAIAEEGYRLLTRNMREAMARAGSTELWTRLCAAGHGYVAFAIAHPAHFRTVFGGFVSPDGEHSKLSPGLREAGDEAYRVMRDLIEEGVRTGALRSGDPDQLSLAAWTMIHGLSMLTIEGQLQALGVRPEDPASVRRATDAVNALLETGLRAPAVKRGRSP